MSKVWCYHFWRWKVMRFLRRCMGLYDYTRYSSHWLLSSINRHARIEILEITWPSSTLTEYRPILRTLRYPAEAFHNVFALHLPSRHDIIGFNFCFFGAWRMFAGSRPWTLGYSTKDIVHSRFWSLVRIRMFLRSLRLMRLDITSCTCQTSNLTFYKSRIVVDACDVFLMTAGSHFKYI